MAVGNERRRRMRRELLPSAEKGRPDDFPLKRVACENRCSGGSLTRWLLWIQCIHVERS